MKGLLTPYASEKAEDLVEHDETLKESLKIMKEL